MSHALVPKGVLDALELAARSFLWQRSANTRSMHYVDLASLCHPRNDGGLGFHATATWSGPLRARFAWEYLQPHQSLFERAMHGRYSENLFTCPPRRSDSAVIKILRDGAASLLSVSRWRIGRGENINILADRWIHDRVLSRWPTFIHSQLPDSMLLSEMLTENGDWNRSKLLQFFGLSLVDTIIQIPTYPAVRRDRHELNFQHSGKTIASMAYAACFPSPSADFSWLSRLGLRPRERLFWWRLALDAIPTRCWLLRRGLTDSGVCPWGCPSPENRDHIMRGSSNVAAISCELHQWGIDMPVVQDWASFPALVSSTRKLDLGPLLVFCYVVYQHWRTRNAKVHGREFGTPLILAATIMENINCSTDFPSTRYWGTNRPDKPSPSSFWCPPAAGLD
ncbi:hypothetical protein KSP39_PZI024112 [Platanthera zijinensis]|uniref:Reverse transcriptase zinc-binding domain-containing protein n=1 Tax=Platanthera zijinensis TaxID=2320716 RepID=A0AAP0ATU5_9ASPA